MCGGHSRSHWGHHIPMSMPIEERKSSPVDILKERLARGEITLDEYQEMRAVLDDRYSAKHSPHIRKPTTV